MLAPTASAIEAHVSSESPAPDTSLGALLKAGNWSVVRPLLGLLGAWISRPSDPILSSTLPAFALQSRELANTANPEPESRNARRASCSVGVINCIPWKREMSPICEDDWLSATAITPD